MYTLNLILIPISASFAYDLVTLTASVGTNRGIRVWLNGTVKFSVAIGTDRNTRPFHTS